MTDDCVELIGKDAVPITGKKGLRFKPDLLPTMNPQRGLTLTFWLKVEQFSVGYNGIDVVFHCGSGSYRTPTMWFRDSQSTRAHVSVSPVYPSGSNIGSESSGNIFQLHAWQHGAYVLKENELAFYVDGLRVISCLINTNPTYPDGTDPFFLGSDGRHKSCCGQFKWVRFYNYALDSQGVKRDMQSVEPICELSNLEKTTLTSYKNLVNNPMHSDVKFRVCGATVYAHRCILCARLKYFQGILGSATSSSEIVIDGVPLDAFRSLLRYLYAGKVPTDPEKALELMVAADYFSVERKLSDHCRNTLTMKLTLENACHLLRTADRFGKEPLKEMIMTFMTKNDNFVQLVGGEELYELPCPLLREFLMFVKPEK